MTSSALEELITATNKRFGEGTLIRASDASQLEIRRATTGSLALDVMLGGGWPLNQWNEVIGNESSGKTAIVLKTIAANMALNSDYEVLWVASEEFVLDWAEELGVDLKRVILCEVNVMEDVYSIVLEHLDNQTVDAVVIDSLPALVPGEEDEKEIEKFTTALGARINNKFFRKSSKSQKRSIIHEERDCLLLMINQWREKIGVMYGDPRTTPGGKGKNFSFFTRVEVARDEWIEPTKGTKVGQAIKARTLKNKTAPPQRVGVVDFYFTDYGGFHTGDYDLMKETFSLGVLYDLITRKGAWYHYDERKWNGGEKFVESLYEEPDLYRGLRAEVLETVTRGKTTQA